MNSAAAAQLAGVPMYADLEPSVLGRLTSMLNEKTLPTTPYFFSSATFIFLVLIWAFLQLISMTMAFFLGKRYTSMNFDQRRTSDIYILNCVLTTAAAALQFASIGAFSLKFYSWQFDLLRIAATFVASNYVVEMIYRPRMRLPMIAHHLLTLFLIMLSLSILYEVKNPSILLSGNMLMFLATLEQPTFIALLMYRLRCSKRSVNFALKFSSVQTIVIKSVAAAGAIAIWFKWQRRDTPSASRAYDILFWISIGGLYSTQWYGCIVTWKISTTLNNRYRSHAESAPARNHSDAADIESQIIADKSVEELTKVPSARRKARVIVSRRPNSLEPSQLPSRTSSLYSPSAPASPSPAATPLPCYSHNPTQEEQQVHYFADRGMPVLPGQTATTMVDHDPSCPLSSPASSLYHEPLSQLGHHRNFQI
ncbi:hypothetical protein OC845_005061 [Tilletia horrida]|nr:hypothetical protein OC845_005061 [Tilletia horrida]